MSEQFQHIFMPLKIRDVVIRNRISITGHGTFMHGGLPTEQLRNYFAERSKGGIGLVVSECGTVDPRYPQLLKIHDENLIPEFKKMTQAVQAHGAKIFQQLGHVGWMGLGARLTFDSSGVPRRYADKVPPVPKAMEIEDIQDVIEMFAKAARNCRAAGYDGVEIHPSYGTYLLSSFISPYCNHRTDEYGGSLENRSRFVFEIIDSVREAVGEDYVVGIQLNADDLTPSGMDFEEWQELARWVDETGKIDYMTIKAGTYWTPNMIIPDMQHPLKLWVPYASGIKRVVKNAYVITVGRINDPTMAEQILAEGHADMVAMTRQHIADPELVNKTKEGRTEDIRPCVACNDGCLGHVYDNMGFSCTHNPAAGNEKEKGIGTLKRAEKFKNVMVVGGGPGGLKTAEVAARRGHNVTLYEKRAQLGGQVRFAAKGAAREELIGITDYLELQIKKLGVAVHLNTNVTTEMILSSDADAVVLANGSLPVRQSITWVPPFDLLDPATKGIDQDNVLTTWDLLEKEVETGQKVVVADDGDGHWKAASIAELLLDQGKQVELISNLGEVLYDIDDMRRFPYLRRVFAKGLVFTPYTAIKEIDGNTVYVYNIHTGQERTIEGVDNVVLAYFGKADEALYFSVKGKVRELYRIGDCLAPRLIGDAIRDGENVAKKL